MAWIDIDVYNDIDSFQSMKLAIPTIIIKTVLSIQLTIIMMH